MLPSVFPVLHIISAFVFLLLQLELIQDWRNLFQCGLRFCSVSKQRISENLHCRILLASHLCSTVKFSTNSTDSKILILIVDDLKASWFDLTVPNHSHQIWVSFLFGVVQQ